MCLSEERIFKEAVKTLIELAKEFGYIKEYTMLTPEVDFGRHMWYLKPETEVSLSPLLKHVDVGKLIELEPIRRAISLMLKKEFPKLLAISVVDDDGKPVENPDYRPHLFCDVLFTMADSYVERFGVEFSEDKFKEIYSEMMEYVYAPYVEYIYVSPLENFELKDAEEVIVASYRIRKLTEWEIKALIGSIGYKLGRFFHPDHGSVETIYCVEKVVKVPKGAPLRVGQFIEDFITSLRLLRSGIMGTNVTLRYPRVWKTYPSASLSLHVYRYTDRLPKYFLEQKDLPLLNKLYRRFTKLKSQLPERVRFSLRWFNKSYIEVELVDRLLDLAIAIESLYEHNCPLVIYVPKFIGSSKEERLEICKNIKELQHIRGAIAHSGYYKQLTQEFVDTIEEYYRRSMHKLLELLERGLKYEEIMKKIKMSIFD